MPFPGNRAFKRRIPIKSSVITGELNFDGVFCLTHVDFPNIPAPPAGTYNPLEAITLGHERAMQQYAADLAASSDEAGTAQLALQVVRADLDATPANSRLEIWVRVPAVSDTVDTDVWLWWGDATEVQPAVNANYGRNDVWNGTTGGGTPIVSWSVIHLDELSSDPAPQFKDSSGNSRDWTATGTTTRSDQAPGRAQNAGGDAVATLSTAWAVGTSSYCTIQVSALPTGGNVHYSLGLNGPSWSYGPDQSVVFTTAGSGSPSQRLDASGSDNYTLLFGAISKSGTSAKIINNIANSTVTGVSGNYTFASPQQLYEAWWGAATETVSFAAYLSCAPNEYWLRAMADNILGAAGSFWDITAGISLAEVAATILFDDLNAGTEVRVYEEPHPQIWTFDLDGLTPAGLALRYITFQIQGSSSASAHYVWFRLDGSGTDPAPGGTGHRVDITTGQSAATMAAAAQAVLDVVTDLGASVVGSVVTVTNDRNGELTTPVDGGTTADILLVQCGGTDATEIDGIESSPGTSWIADYSILRPRRASIVMLSIAYENVRYSTILTTAGLVVPAGALQREDRNYYNPA
jgi:hypothetical protein